MTTEPIHVLHVDDEEALLDLSATFLERADDGLTVATETDPTAVLDRVDDEPVDCLVTDYDMPDVDGIDLIRRVRDRWPGLPVVLFTGKGSAAVAQEAIEAGATDYLQKEVGTEQYAVLANRVRNAVERRRARRRAARLERELETVTATAAADLRAALTAAEDARQELLGEAVERDAAADRELEALRAAHERIRRAAAELDDLDADDVEVRSRVLPVAANE